ncbi:MAG: hypothetical protein ACOY3D_05890 [Candidatus Omnitrophota bacterium]
MMDYASFMLIALAIGYLIVIKGDKEKGFLRALGLVTGFFVMVMSFFMVILFTSVINYTAGTSGIRRPAVMRHMMPMRQMPRAVK